MKTVVNSWNEWDPLKHVIVGRADDCHIPPEEPALDAKVPEDSDMRGQWGRRPQETIDRLNEYDNTEVVVIDEEGSHNFTMSRFTACDDDDVAVIICDSDYGMVMTMKHDEVTMMRRRTRMGQARTMKQAPAPQYASSKIACPSSPTSTTHSRPGKARRATKLAQT